MVKKMLYRFVKIQISDESRDKFWSLMYAFEIARKFRKFAEMNKNISVFELLSKKK